jgi:cystathionine beta-lyase/cystathionine gamma-synthase
MADLRALSQDTLAIHGGQSHEPVTGAVMQPIVLSTTFAQEGPGGHKGFEYGRSGNPTRNALEACLASIEGGKHGFAYGSGLAATTNVAHLLRPGDHVVCGDDVYGGTFRLFDKIMKPMGIDLSMVDLADPAKVKAALRPSTKLIWLETPSNPMLKIFDIAKVAEVAHAAKIMLAVDNTFATPILQSPLSLGATLVMHSTTKYINGHSDAVGGAIVTSDEELAQRLRFAQNAIGAVPSPFDCYLVLRGIKTLPVRMRQHVASARAIAERLAGHAQVAKVYYPGLPSHPGHAIASKQMRGPGGMISFELKGSLENAKAFLSALRIFACAESLGGVESLAEHPAIMTHASVPADARRALGISDGLVRLSVGLEAESDLWDDIERGFSAARDA